MLIFYRVHFFFSYIWSLFYVYCTWRVLILCAFGSHVFAVSGYGDIALIFLKFMDSALSSLVVVALWFRLYDDLYFFVRFHTFCIYVYAVYFITISVTTELIIHCCVHEFLCLLLIKQKEGIRNCPALHGKVRHGLVSYWPIFVDHSTVWV
jgi:hypothetical protein